jgi:rfaE bifunctional protein kinase chain/domain
MTPARFDALIARFRTLRLGVVGDFSLDRYFDIDPARAEKSLETGLPVHNVTRVRCQPGAAGNIVQNLAALSPAALWPVGYCGDDGEGFELRRALRRLGGMQLDHFLQPPTRLTFTYTKPLVHTPGQPPKELARLDIKNWTPTPATVESALIASLQHLAPQLDALIVMDQAAAPGAGVVSRGVLAAVAAIARAHPPLVIMADSRHGLTTYPPLCFKMNAAEFALLTGRSDSPAELFDHIPGGATELAQRNGRPVFITLAERGMIGAAPGGRAVHVPALPVHGPIDIVGAGDTVTAMLTLALTAGANLREAMELAQAAASVVVHQLGTTGTATPLQLQRKLFP